MKLFRTMIVLGVAALGFQSAVACNDTLRGDGSPQPCTGDFCTCEQDPYQPRCKGYSGDPEPYTGDAQPVESSTPDAPEGDAEAEASLDDASDDGG